MTRIKSVFLRRMEDKKYFFIFDVVPLDVTRRKKKKEKKKDEGEEGEGGVGGGEGEGEEEGKASTLRRK